ncbi:MAG: L-histidine N(alpha)-methyltransferase [Archangium sp.]|nr:L-histidine N(alpha)-methyltransferase [Archangium sp.]MDP3573477.1 L-histidine N(alpha)-methyltransferase [Archangium sp.]
MNELELIRAGLTARQKNLPSALLYDDLGSVLFEAITLLPEYEVARVDTALLAGSLREALSLLPGPLEVIELGPGHGRKARVVLESVVARQPSTSFVAVDVSAAALEGCRRHLEDLSTVTFTGLEATFVDGLRRAPARLAGQRRLVLFLGSNLSNFDRADSLQFFVEVRDALEPGDAMLLSTDLEKPAARLLPAYDDALGVTSAFNKNVLVRLNREYGANFDLTAFTHEARWNAEARRVEMHLRALRETTVDVRKLELALHFDERETVWTESSHRFNLGELRAWGLESGLHCTKSWVNDAWPLALSLFIAT